MLIFLPMSDEPVPTSKPSSSRKATRMTVAQKAALRSGKSVAEAYDAFAVFMVAMREALIETGNLELRGFGVFKVVTRKGRPGRNPRNPGCQVWIPERSGVRFVPSATLDHLLQTSTTSPNELQEPAIADKKSIEE